MKNLASYLKEVLKIYKKLYTQPSEVNNSKILIQSLQTTAISFFICILISITIFLLLY